MRSDDIILELIKELRKEVSPLFRVCESIALVDMIASFGQVTTIRDYVRPEIEETLALKSARHPILDKVTLCLSNKTSYAFCTKCCLTENGK